MESPDTANTTTDSTTFSRPPASLKSSLALVLAITACLVFIGLGRLPLLEPDEGRNAEIAREMLVSGDWVTPHYDTLTYLDKPPVLFWMIAGAYRCFGISEWSARFPSAIFGLASVLLVWAMARRMIGERKALYAALIFATSPLAFGLARFVIFDMPLTFFEALAIFFIWLSSERGFSRSFDVATGAAMGVATLIKGPVGFLIPLLTLVVYQALIGKWKDLKKAHWLSGAAVFFAITFPWFIAVSLRHPSFPRYALWTESWARYTSGSGMHRTGGLWYYIPVYLAGFFPWSCFLLAAVFTRLRNWKRLWQESCRTEIFLATWTAVVFVFFSISHSQLPEYFLPALLPLALLTARVWPRKGTGNSGAENVPGWFMAGYGLVILAGLLMIAGGAASWANHSHFARRLPPSLVSQIHPALIYGGIIVGALGLLGRNTASRWRKDSNAAGSPAFAILALTVPLLVVRSVPLVRRYFNVLSSRQLGRTILQSRERDEPVYGYYYFRTGLPFYLRHPVGLITSSGVELTSNYMLAHYREDLAAPLQPSASRPSGGARGRAGSSAGVWGAEHLLINSRELARLSKSPPGPFLLLVQNDEAGSMMRMTGPLAPLWGAWKYSIWEKQAISHQPSAPSKQSQVVATSLGCSPGLPERGCIACCAVGL
jgi:4-amino-4-deoxy-L-arabinose transferase-like glycosyltransferase